MTGMPVPDVATPKVRFRFRVACRPEPPAELIDQFWSDYARPAATLDAAAARSARLRSVLRRAEPGTTLHETETGIRPHRFELVGVMPVLATESWTVPVHMTTPAERAAVAVVRLAQWALYDIYGHRGAADHLGSIAVPGLELSITEVTGE